MFGAWQPNMARSAKNTCGCGGVCGGDSGGGGGEERAPTVAGWYSACPFDCRSFARSTRLLSASLRR